MAKALAKDAEERYATCGELVEAAADALGRVAQATARWPLLAVASIAAVVVAAVMPPDCSFEAGPPPRRLWGADPGSTRHGTLDPIGPDHRKRARHVPGRRRAVAVAVGAGGVWAASYPSDVLWKVDPGSGAVTTTGTPWRGLALAATDHAVYAVFDGDGMEGHPFGPRCRWPTL